VTIVINVEEQINSVHRQVGTKTIEAGEAKTLIISQTYPATVEDVWDACTNAERIPRWFLPVSGDLRLGGKYQLEGNAGGTIEACDPPHSFAATWEFGGEVSWIEVRISGVGDDKATLEIEHLAVVDDARWLEYGPGAVGVGWDGALLGLAQHLSGQPALDPEEAMAWMTSTEGKRFYTASSERWGDAHITIGGDPEAARAAADRTTAFYTGASE
jgi:uncharacterized protein YndB with AHSA1/START domain